MDLGSLKLHKGRTVLIVDGLLIVINEYYLTIKVHN